MKYCLALAGLSLLAGAAQAQTDAIGLPGVEIIGSRIQRIDAETALPVQMIRREEIERSGVRAPKNCWPVRANSAA